MLAHCARIYSDIENHFTGLGGAVGTTKTNLLVRAGH